MAERSEDIVSSDWSASSSDTKPLTLDDFNRTLEYIYRKRPPEPEYPKQFCDWDKVCEHGIRMGFDSMAGMWLMSSSEMRRAREVGAIWWEDENGNRISSANKVDMAKRKP